MDSLRERYAKRYEENLRRGLRKAEIYGFLFGYGSEKVQKIIDSTLYKALKYDEEMKEMGIEVFRTKEVIGLENKLLDLGSKVLLNFLGGNIKFRRYTYGRK